MYFEKRSLTKQHQAAVQIRGKSFRCAKIKDLCLLYKKLWLPVGLSIRFSSHLSRNHPFKMLAFFRREGSKIGQICCLIIVKNCQGEGGREQKSWKFADVLNDGPLEVLKCAKISFVKVNFIILLEIYYICTTKGFGPAVI